MEPYRKIAFSILIVAFTLLFLQPQMLHAQSGISPSEIERVGQSGWQFLKINGDPRQAALGGTFLTSSNPTANVVFGNPALLAWIENYDIQFNNVSWLADLKYTSISAARSYAGIGTFAISYVGLDYGDIPETIHTGIQGGGTVPLVTGETFTARDMAIGVSYARQITQQLALGGNLRYLNEEIAGTGMSNWSLDFSTMYYTGLRSLRLAITARNFGPDAHLVGYSEELQSEPVDIRMPIELRGGIAYDWLDGKSSHHLLTTILEGKVPSDGNEKIHFGTEYSYRNLFSARGGYRFNYDEEGLTLGIGFKFPVGTFNCSLNYAYLDFGALTQVNMFSFGLSF
ncbi:MAG: PorV/PorQ family protein [Candidatus Marinimicrobia bacterium]|nr:PorV/PorQ family protein [Candidatus Neomarinimicrobiota bacterium]